MKRMIKTLADPEELSFKIDVYHMLVDAETEIAADTEIKDICRKKKHTALRE